MNATESLVSILFSRQAEYASGVAMQTLQLEQAEKREWIKECQQLQLQLQALMEKASPNMPVVIEVPIAQAAAVAVAWAAGQVGNSTQSSALHIPSSVASRNV